MMKRYYYDSYAVIEFLSGNERYKQYFDSSIQGALTKLNLAEIYYRLRNQNSIDAQQVASITNQFTRFVIDYLIEDVFHAMEFKLEHKSKSFSYVDCIGYYLARKQSIPFLTGDSQFEGLAGVEFVK